MSESFTPLSLTLSQVFINGDPIYKIPSYQRPYSWTDEQIYKLWDDLKTAYENNKEENDIDTNYFLGSLIVVPGENVFEDVVDGQQRLTTIMILFNVVKSLFPNLNKEVDASLNPDVIKIPKIINCIKNTNDISRLRLYTHPNRQNDFSALILDVSDFSKITKPTKKDIKNSPSRRFTNTAYIFYTELSKMKEEQVGNFINYLFNQVKLIKVSCSNRSFAIKLFQVLNNRGLDLSPADLIKSILLSSFKDDKQYDAFVADWQAVEQKVENLDVDVTDLFTFYEYYLLEENPKRALVDQLEKEFKGEDANKIINDFKKFITSYEERIWNETGDKVIYSLYCLPWAAYWKTIILSAIHAEYNDIEQLKNSLLRFYYLYWIAGKTLTAIKQTSFNVISLIKKNKSISEINKEFDKQVEKDKIISSVLSNLSGDIYYESWIKPLLIMIEYNQTDGDFVSKIYWNKSLQIEHILPQSFANHSDWKHIENKDGNYFLQTGGNLTLLSSKKNIEAKNYSFKDKIKIYSGEGKNNTKKDGITSFRISQQIVDDFNSNKFGKEWTVKAMISRYNWFISEVGTLLNINVDAIKKDEFNYISEQSKSKKVGLLENA